MSDNPMRGPLDGPDPARAAFIAQVRVWWKTYRPFCMDDVEAIGEMFDSHDDFASRYIEQYGLSAALEAIAEAQKETL